MTLAQDIDEAVGLAQIRGSSLVRQIAALPLDDYDPAHDDDDTAWEEFEVTKSVILGPDPDPTRPLAASPLGLGGAKRLNTRQRMVRGAMLAYRNRERVHYTQGAARWQGIRSRRRSMNGQYPNWADCSAFYTWLAWDATRIYNLHDFVNGYSWLAGFTGTMTRKGVVVRLNRLLLGDALFYGGTFSRPAHVAIYVGNGRVISFGSERGPYLLHYNYRRINHARRYVR